MAEIAAGPRSVAEDQTALRQRSLAVPAFLTWSMVAALTGGALALRLHGLAHESVWLDEGYTLLFSHLPFPQLIVVGGAHEHPPLYYLIAHLLFGLRDSYLVPRAISALAGALSIPALFALGNRLVGRFPGFVAAALLAVSPFHLWYSQDGRAYELAGLLVVLSYLALFNALSRHSRAPFALYALLTVLCLYTEYTTAFALLPQILLLVPARRAGLTRRLVCSWLAVLLLFAPWVGTLALDTASIAGHYWIPPPTWSSFVNTALQFLGMRTPCPSPPCVGQEVRLPLLLGHEGVVALGSAALAVIALAVFVVRRNVTLTVLGLWLCLPFLLVLLLAVKQSFYLDRVFLDATYPLYLLLGTGLGFAVRRLAGAVVAAAPIAIILGSSVAGAQTVATTTTNPDWRSLSRDLTAVYRPGQAVVLVPGVVRWLIWPYVAPDWRPTREGLLWYHAYLDVPGWTRKYARWTDGQLRDVQLASFTKGTRRVWLVTMDYTGTNDTRLWFEEHGYHLLLSELYAGDTRLELWDRGLPRELGPPALPDRGFAKGWRSLGKVRIVHAVATESGHAVLTRSFSVRSGVAYTVNVEWKSIPPAYPQISVQTFDRAGHLVGLMRDRFGYLESSFPRTEWYSLPATGVWLSQPFGFVTPPGSVRATIRVANLWGQTSWRHIAVYHER